MIPTWRLDSLCVVLRRAGNQEDTGRSDCQRRKYNQSRMLARVASELATIQVHGAPDG
jgi:hypothetical protein